VLCAFFKFFLCVLFFVLPFDIINNYDDITKYIIKITCDVKTILCYKLSLRIREEEDYSFLIYLIS